MYVDQFNNKTLGVALAASYQDQPSLQRLVEHWGFNENNSGTVNGGDGKVDKTPWGIQDEVKRGRDERTSVLGKVEWKPSTDALITGDAYYEKQAIREPELSHYFSNTLGNWNGGNSANYGNGCGDANRTTFSDSAAAALSGQGPYVGTFRPDQALSAFAGKSAAGTPVTLSRQKPAL